MDALNLVGASQAAPRTAAQWVFLNNGDSFVTWWRSEGSAAFEVVQRSRYLPTSADEPEELSWMLFTCWHPGDPSADPDDYYGGPQVQEPLTDALMPCRVERSHRWSWPLDDRTREAIQVFYADLPASS